MDDYRRKILVAVVVAVGIGFAVLFGVSFASANQSSGVMNQPFASQFNAYPQAGFSGSQFNMIPPTGQMAGPVNPSMGGFGSTGMTPGGMNMMGMMNMMMPGMTGPSVMPNMPSATMAGMSFVPLDGPHNSSGKPLTIDQAQSIAVGFLNRLNNQDLVIGVLKEYSNNFYVAFGEKNTGIYAFEVLIDKLTGAVYAEPGPNMFWNAKYRFFVPSFAGTMEFNQQFSPQFTMPPMGPMAGMMSPGMGSMSQGTFGSGMLNMQNTPGVINIDPNTQNMPGMGGMSTMPSNTMGGMNMTMGQIGSMQGAPFALGWVQMNPFASTIMLITPQQAQQLAQQFLNTYFQGTTAGNVRMFYGYYTVDILQNGNLHCNLSVNGYTGQVWYKTWHIGFVQQIGT